MTEAEGSKKGLIVVCDCDAEWVVPTALYGHPDDDKYNAPCPYCNMYHWFVEAEEV